jgi:hypothetical protein
VTGSVGSRDGDHKKRETAPGLLSLSWECCPVPRSLDTAGADGFIALLMGGNKLVKVCSVVGFILAEVYMVFAVLAPYRPGRPARMIIPKEMIPKIEGVEPGTMPPPGALAVKLVICAFFFGPFGAFVGLGAGLLLEGARQTVVTWRSGSRPQS